MKAMVDNVFLQKEEAEVANLPTAKVTVFQSSTVTFCQRIEFIFMNESAFFLTPANLTILVSYLIAVGVEDYRIK